MIINDNILSLPPYLSTSWNNINCLHMRDGILVVTLNDGQQVDVPTLDRAVLEKVFVAHATFLDRQSSTPQRHSEKGTGASFAQNRGGVLEQTLPFPRLAMGGFDNIGAALQHNPSQANAPDLPPEILQKIAAIAKIVSPDDPMAAPKPEPHCNCVHCQISRAIQKGLHVNDEQPPEEEVSQEELTFCEWDIQQAGDQFYQVTNRLDAQESYKVHLGTPVGCTCGKNGCEHIIAVLHS